MTAEGQAQVIGEILTWAGVGVAAWFTYALYRAAERANPPSEAKEPAGTEQSNEKEAV